VKIEYREEGGCVCRFRFVFNSLSLWLLATTWRNKWFHLLLYFIIHVNDRFVACDVENTKGRGADESIKSRIMIWSLPESHKDTAS